MDVKVEGLTITSANGDVVIEFDASWIKAQMQISHESQVPFKFYGTKNKMKEDNRLYPRSIKTDIVLMDKKTQSPSHGGRPHMEPSKVFTLGGSYSSQHDKPVDGFVLSDLLILHKRAFSSRCVEKSPKYTFFDLKNRHADIKLEHRMFGLFELHSYPLLCIYLRDVDVIKADQSWARVCQIVFTAYLNRALFAKDAPLQVVAREGFGSPFPTVCDLGNGFRLDPGLLDVSSVDMVLEALAVVDEFLAHVVRQKCNLKDTLGKLEGVRDSELQAVDRLTYALSVAIKDKKLSMKEVVDVLSKDHRPNETLNDCFASNKTGKVVVVGAARLKLKSQRRLDKPTKHKDDGYGSDSDEEGDDEQPFLIKKFAFVSGMAAIRLTTEIALVYAQIVGGKHRKLRLEETDTGFGEDQFMLQYFELGDIMEPRNVAVAGQEVAHFNAAPNPRNHFQAAQKFLIDAPPCVCSIDVTNITTEEKALYARAFLRTLRNARSTKLLLLVESASKHPTGGDIVYGVVRVVGLPHAVRYYGELLASHAKNKDKDGTNLLSQSEHLFRHTLIDLGLVSRNRDLREYMTL